jgi:hypothetical protein
VMKVFSFTATGIKITSTLQKIKLKRLMNLHDIKLNHKPNMILKSTHAEK